jgi:hypothetical protein
MYPARWVELGFLELEPTFCFLFFSLFLLSLITSLLLLFTSGGDGHCEDYLHMNGLVISVFIFFFNFLTLVNN